jgi:hypothetical protein
MVVKKNTNFWIGTEVEGRYKGATTLFIRGDQDKHEIESIIIDNFILHLYFGAGNQSKITNFKTPSYFSYEGFLVTIEVYEEELKNIPAYILNDDNIYIVVTFKNKYLSKLKCTDAIKVEDDKRVWVSSLECMSKTFKKSAYKGDKIIQ